MSHAICLPSIISHSSRIIDILAGQFSWKPILGVLPLTHRLSIDIVYKHTYTNVETGLKG